MLRVTRLIALLFVIGIEKRKNVWTSSLRCGDSQEQVEELYEEIPELFREPTFQEKYQVYDYVYHWKPHPSIVFVDCHLELVI